MSNMTIHLTIPWLLSEGLNIHLRIFILDQKKIIFVRDFGDLDSESSVNILVIKEHLHYLPLFKDGDFEVDEKAMDDMVDRNSKPQAQLSYIFSEPGDFYHPIGRFINQSY